MPKTQEENVRIADKYSKSDGSVSLAKECYRILYGISHKYGVTDKGKSSNKHRVRNWSKQEYRIQENTFLRKWI